MGWFGARLNEKFEYIRTSYPDFQEAEEYGTVTGGNIELTWLSPTRQSCEFDFTGMTVPDKNDAVRIYYSFDDIFGSHFRQMIGTFLVGKVVPKVNLYNGVGVYSGKVNCNSVLRVLADAGPGYPYTVPAGTNTVAKAKSLAQNIGEDTTHSAVNHLTVEADESSHSLSSAHTFDKNDKWLTIINWLLAQAGFVGCDVSTNGTVLMKRKRSETAPRFGFEIGRNAILVPGVTPSSNMVDTPNVCRVTYESDNICITAWAKNESGSPASLSERKWREITMTEEVTELSSEQETLTQAVIAAMRAELETIAKNALIDKSSQIEYLDWKHAYVPLNGGDTVSVTYDREYELTLTNMKVQLEEGMQCTSSGRAFVENSLVITTGSSVVWSV